MISAEIEKTTYQCRNASKPSGFIGQRTDPVAFFLKEKCVLTGLGHHDIADCGFVLKILFIDPI